MRARLVIGDQSSQEFDELRRNFNALLLLLEDLGARLAAEVVTAPSAADGEILAVFQSLSDAITSGADTDPNTLLVTHVPTSLEINGLKPTPRHPTRRAQPTVAMVVGDDL